MGAGTEDRMNDYPRQGRDSLESLNATRRVFRLRPLSEEEVDRRKADTPSALVNRFLFWSVVAVAVMATAYLVARLS